MENISDAVYKLFPLETLEQVKELISEDKNLCGLNVTIPYKIPVIELLDEVDEAAKKIGAVNCIKIRDQKLSGFNTDYSAFLESVTPFINPKNSKALILGNGGSAYAVAEAFNHLGIPFTKITRNLSNNECKLFSELNEEMIQNNNIIVNATQLGMFPHTELFPPIPYQFIADKHLLFDLVYNPAETSFMRKGKARGATVVNGLDMLYKQAEKSWQIWNS